MSKFTQATESEKKKALGSLKGSPVVLIRTLETSESFHIPVPDPGPDDWLAFKTERGQTYDKFSLKANIPGPGHNIFYVQPYDIKVKSHLLNTLISYASAFFPGIKLEVLKKINISEAGVKSRENSPGEFQYNATQLLKIMKKNQPKTNS